MAKCANCVVATNQNCLLPCPFESMRGVAMQIQAAATWSLSSSPPTPPSDSVGAVAMEGAIDELAHAMDMSTATMQAQYAAYRLGVVLNQVSFEYGGSRLLGGNMAGGASQIAAMAAAVTAEADGLVREVPKLAANDSPVARLRGRRRRRARHRRDRHHRYRGHHRQRRAQRHGQARARPADHAGQAAVGRRQKRRLCPWMTAPPPSGTRASRTMTTEHA